MVGSDENVSGSRPIARTSSKRVTAQNPGPFGSVVPIHRRVFAQPAVLIVRVADAEDWPESTSRFACDLVPSIVELQRQRFEPAQQVRTDAPRRGRCRASTCWRSREQRAHRNACLDPRQRRADTEVNAIAERQMPAARCGRAEIRPAHRTTAASRFAEPITTITLSPAAMRCAVEYRRLPSLRASGTAPGCRSATLLRWPLSISSGSRRSRSHRSGRSASTFSRLPSRFVVVSFPAISNRMLKPMISHSDKPDSVDLGVDDRAEEIARRVRPSLRDQLAEKLRHLHHFGLARRGRCAGQRSGQRIGPAFEIRLARSPESPSSAR